MLHHVSRASALAAALLLAACTAQESTPIQQGAASPETNVAAVRLAIDSVNAKLIDALQRGDSTAAALLYDEQGMTMPPSIPASVGRGEIQKGFAGMFREMSIREMKLEIGDVVASGDLAVETGRFEWTVVPKKGKPMTERGKYVVAWRRQPDGSWKLYRDIFNYDPPEQK